MDAAKPKRPFWSTFFWWRIDVDELNKQVEQYATLNVFKSVRGASLLLCLLTVAVTMLASRFLGIMTSEAAIEAFIWTSIGVGMYLGSRWAFVAGMVLWTLEKGYFIATSGRVTVVHVLFWVFYMRVFYLGYHVEKERAGGTTTAGRPPKLPPPSAPTATDGEVFVCRQGTAAGPKDYVTPLRPDFVQQYGLPPNAIVGEVTRRLAVGEKISPDSFAANPAFLDFLSGFLEAQAAQDPKMKSEAHRIVDGWVQIVDQRTRAPRGSEPAEDVVGAIQVANGVLVPGSFKRGEQYQLLSKAGFFKLGQKNHAALLQLLRASAEATTSKDAWNPE